MVKRSGAGPPPCPIGQLTTDSLAAKFSELSSATARAAAEVSTPRLASPRLALTAPSPHLTSPQGLRDRMATEDGVAVGCAHLLGELPREFLLCDVSLLLDPPLVRLATYDLARTSGVLWQLLALVVGLAAGLVGGPMWFASLSDTSRTKSIAIGFQGTSTQDVDGRWMLLVSLVFGLSVALLVLHAARPEPGHLPSLSEHFPCTSAPLPSVASARASLWWRQRAPPLGGRYMTQLVRMELQPEGTQLKVSSEVVGSCINRAARRRKLPWCELPSHSRAKPSIGISRRVPGGTSGGRWPWACSSTRTSGWATTRTCTRPSCGTRRTSRRCRRGCSQALP